MRQPSSLGNFLDGFRQVSGIHVRLEVKLGSRVVSEEMEQEINAGRTTPGLGSCTVCVEESRPQRVWLLVLTVPFPSCVTLRSH